MILTIHLKTNYMKKLLLIASFIALSCLITGNLSAQITSAASGNWSATATWVGGVVPTSTDNVLIAATHVVTVDDATAVCNNMTFGALTSQIAMGSGGVLGIYGNFTLFSTTHKPFSTWAAGAKVKFTGSAELQSLLGWSTGSTTPHTFMELQIDKSAGKLVTTGNGGKLTIGTSIEIINGTLEIANADDLYGRDLLGDLTRPTITIQSGGTFTLAGGLTQINAYTGSSSGAIGKMTIYGIANLATTSSAGIRFSNIDVESGGSLSLPGGWGTTSTNTYFYPGVITLKTGATLTYSSTSKRIWDAAASLVAESGSTINITTSSAITPPLNITDNGATWKYSLNGSQTGVLARTYTNLEFGGSGIKTLSGTTTVTGSLNLNGSAGLALSLENNNIILGASATCSGILDKTNMVVANYSGSFKKEWTTAGSFVFPIGVGMTATASSTISTGVLQTIVLTNGGAGYYIAPTVEISGGGGAGATATASIDRVLKSISLVNGGVGYTTAPTVEITGGGGTGATATATITGDAVTSFTITNSGTGFTSNPTIVLTGGGATTEATATATITLGEVTGFTITNSGGGYTSAPSVTISSPRISYAPIEITNSAANTIAAKVVPTITNPVMFENKAIQLEWLLAESTPGSNSGTAQFQFNANDAGADFDIVKTISLGIWNGTEYDVQDVTASGTDPYTVSYTLPATIPTNPFVIGNRGAFFDLTPPIWTAEYPKTANPSGSGFDVKVNLNEKGKAYFVVLSDGATAPTPAEVKNGTASAGGAALNSGTIDCEVATTEYTASVSGLTSNTTFDVYFVAEDTLQNIQIAVEKRTILTIPDVIAPEWTSLYPKTESISGSGFTAIANLNEPGNVYLVVLASGAAAPTPAEVKAGKESGGGNALKSDTIRCSASSTEYTSIITGLNQQTSYDVYFVAEDDIPNLQTSVTKISITTIDDLAPAWTDQYPKLDSPSIDGFTIKVNLGEIGKVYYVVLNQGSAAPISAEVKAGTGFSGSAALKSGTIQCTAINTEYTEVVTGLNQKTIYDVYFVTEDGVPNLQTTPTKVSITTLDATAPEWITGWPKAESITTFGFTLRVEINEPGKVYFVILPTGSQLIPTSIEVKEGTAGGGQPAVATGLITCTAGNTEYTSVVSTLEPLTGYDTYFVAEDIFSNIQSTTASVLGVTTLKVAPSLPLYEPINYTTGQTIHTQADWELVTTSATDALVASGNLTYADLLASTGNKISWDGAGSEPTKLFTSQSGTGTKIYYSFVFQVTSMSNLTDATTGTNFAGLGNHIPATAPYGACTMFKWDGEAGKDKFYIGHQGRGLTANSSVWTTTKYSINTPIFVVGCYEYVDGASNDKTYLWINPSASVFEASTEPTPILQSETTPSLDLGVVDRFYIRQDTDTRTPFMELDEIRVGLTWADVTPKASTISVNKSVWDNIRVYPNPVADYLYIENVEDIKLAKLNNILGQELMSINVNNQKLEINMRDLLSGVYILTFYDTKGMRYSKRVVKK